MLLVLDFPCKFIDRMPLNIGKIGINLSIFSDNLSFKTKIIGNRQSFINSHIKNLIDNYLILMCFIKEYLSYNYN
jgi:hypothetical protein